MEEQIEIHQDLSGIPGIWPVDAFNEAYPPSISLQGAAIITMSSEPGNPDKTSMVTLRTFIENGNRAKNDQKYVIGVRFYSFGDMATIDVISLDKGFHREIAFEHLTRMRWQSFGEDIRKSVSPFDETTRAPFVFVGGHLTVKQDKVDFVGTSGDYGNDIFLAESNAIATYVAAICGIETGLGNKVAGESFIEELLRFMLNNKLRKDFYEQFIGFIHDKDPAALRAFTAQHLGSLITMKVADRVLDEGTDTIQTLVDEISEGLGRYVLVSGVAAKVKAGEED